jgi:hypothetical protein
LTAETFAEAWDVSMIFPGMDPYLEDPQLWPDVHTSLIVYIRDYLQPLLRPRYLAGIEKRVYLEGQSRDIIPDVHLKRRSPAEKPTATATALADEPDLVGHPDMEIQEPYLAIMDRQTGRTVVAVIEVISPTNKYAGPGRESYVDKQGEVRRSQAHLVEIDLLRAGPHVAAVPESMARARGAYDYVVCVNRAWGGRAEFELYRRRVRERLPRIRIPLAGDDPDVVLDLQTVLNHTYEAADYGDQINYLAPCVPPLTPADQEWANQLIRQALPST